ncbi:UNVERIFIED_CONTAM: hypothetical protein FKN15_006363 [Acipenser sinensis]
MRSVGSGKNKKVIEINMILKNAEKAVESELPEVPGTILLILVYFHEDDGLMFLQANNTCLTDEIPASSLPVSPCIIFVLVTWYRQEPDGRIQIVTSLSTGYLKEGRYSATLDNKNGQYNLTIADLHRTDSAVYFCIVRAALVFAPGSSTKLVVSGNYRYSNSVLEGGIRFELF